MYNVKKWKFHIYTWAITPVFEYQLIKFYIIKNLVLFGANSHNMALSCIERLTDQRFTSESGDVIASQSPAFS